AGGKWSNRVHHRITWRRTFEARAPGAAANGGGDRRDCVFPAGSGRSRCNQYTIGYKPSRPQSEGGFRTVKVDANAKGYKKLQVRTRSGYYAGQNRAASDAPADKP